AEILDRIGDFDIETRAAVERRGIGVRIRREMLRATAASPSRRCFLFGLPGALRIGLLEKERSDGILAKYSTEQLTSGSTEHVPNRISLSAESVRLSGLRKGPRPAPFGSCGSFLR